MNKCVLSIVFFINFILNAAKKLSNFAGMVNRFKRINAEIKYYGLFNIVRTKAIELHYKRKFKNLGIVYYRENNPVNVLNTLSVNKDACLNQATDYYTLKKAFDFAGIIYSKINLLDIGCGYGKVLNFGMLMNFKTVIGIDLDEAAVDIAISNAGKMEANGFKTPYHFHTADACHFQIPVGINIIFMANPFGEKTMQQVMANIIAYQQNINKDLYIVYSVPVHQDVLNAYIECKKIYESFNGDKTSSEIVIYKINNK
jgi:SAM-dependent methyltransferase